MKDSKKRHSLELKDKDSSLDLKIDGVPPQAKRPKLEPPTGQASAVHAAAAAAATVQAQAAAVAAQKSKLVGQVPMGLRPGMTPATAAASLQQTAASKAMGVANGLPTSISVMPTQAGNLANVAAAASLMGPLNAVAPPHLVGHTQILAAAGQNPGGFPMQPGLPGNHNQIKAFLDHISLGQYWRLLSENGCDTLEDLASADVQMLVNLGFKIFHANRLVTAVHRFIRPTPPVINPPQKRKRASHVRTFAEMYQRVEEFQNLVSQVGSMSAAERDPRSTISRGAYTQYLRIKELAEKENISLTSEKYVNIKPTEKNVKEIIQKEKQLKNHMEAAVAANGANIQMTVVPKFQNMAPAVNVGVPAAAQSLPQLPLQGTTLQRGVPQVEGVLSQAP